MYSVNWDFIFEQIKINWDEKRLEWNPKELKANVFELLAFVKTGLRKAGIRIKLVGNPKRLTQDLWGWDFEE